MTAKELMQELSALVQNGHGDKEVVLYCDHGQNPEKLSSIGDDDYLVQGGLICEDELYEYDIKEDEGERVITLWGN